MRQKAGKQKHGRKRSGGGGTKPLFSLFSGGGFPAPGVRISRGVNRKRQEAIFIWCHLCFPLFQWKMSLDSTNLLSEQQTPPVAVPRLSFLSGGLDAVFLCGDLGGPRAQPGRKQVVHFRDGSAWNERPAWLPCAQRQISVLLRRSLFSHQRLRGVGPLMLWTAAVS